MRNAAQAMLAELERESASTRRLLERVPADQLEWRPHPKSMTLGQLSLHLATIPRSFVRLGKLDGLDAAAVDFTPASPQGAEQLLPFLEASLAEAREFWGSLDDDALAAPWRMTAGEREVFTLPRMELLRTLVLNHIYHHRGQLGLYLRLLDIPVPAVYGRSADENPFAAAPAG
jgi:uncharacterized damage-inducible protein DinB